MPDSVFPVCSPRLIANRGRIHTIEDLLALPLLHDSATEGDGSGSDWRSWLDHLGRSDLSCPNGQRFSDAGLLIDAAALGLGVALARASLAADLVADGALIRALPFSAPTAFAYYLLALPEADHLPKIVCFRDWLQTEAAAALAPVPASRRMNLQSSAVDRAA